MASLKAERPLGTQLFGVAKKETAKPAEGASKAPSASKSGTKKAAPKSQEIKKKAKGGKSAAKH